MSAFIRIRRAMSDVRPVLWLVVAAAAATAAGDAAFGQGAPDCGQLLGQIQALDRANAASNPYGDAIQKQRTELDQQLSYAHSIGCDRQQFLFFGSPPPAQCPQIKAQIARMRANLAQLQASAAASNDTPQRQDLVARYNAACRQQQQQQARPRGFFESLFGGGNPQQGTGDVPGAGGVPPPDAAVNPTAGAEALCVRTCDGGFFPLIYSSHRVPPETLSELCKASCPNTDVKVYTRVPGDEVKTAVGLDGTPYMSLPNALKFEKTYDASCSCKPPGQSWAQALQSAEAVLGTQGHGDIIVTPEKSAELSRPKPDATGKRAKADAKAAKANKPTATTDDATALDAANSAQVPTASNDTAGIATGDLKPTASFPQGEGKTVEVTGPDGTKHQVRIVGPQP
jgi:hypothetical protein